MHRSTTARAAAVAAAAALLLGTLASGSGAATAAPAGPSAGSADSAGAAATPAGLDGHRPPQSGPCQYTPTPDDPAARPVSLPPDPDPTPDRGLVNVELRTNLGDIDLVLDRSLAPCTVQSFIHLTRSKFYDRTFCHRLTAYPTLKVLQCGDPSGTGSGGPGYRYRDELPVGLPPAPTDPTGQRKVYARGVLAMANAGPDTNGSQFFLVYGNSALRPNYSIFGSVTADGLRTLDAVAAGGVTPTPGGPTPPVDGPPALRTDIHKAKIRHHH
ncbi:MAG TPA: peptidylprolyl isomerase [Pseudonocardiaceae bacterium]